MGIHTAHRFKACEPTQVGSDQWLTLAFIKFVVISMASIHNSGLAVALKARLSVQRFCLAALEKELVRTISTGCSSLKLLTVVKCNGITQEIPAPTSPTFLEVERVQSVKLVKSAFHEVYFYKYSQNINFSEPG